MRSKYLKTVEALGVCASASPNTKKSEHGKILHMTISRLS
jgi:hypothetical protein